MHLRILLSPRHVRTRPPSPQLTPTHPHTHTQQDQNYASLLKSLLIQSLIKIEEATVTVYCRPADVPAVTSALPAAVAEYSALMKSKAGVKISPNATMNADPSKNLPDSCLGGVVVTADEGRVVCDNTMKAR